jgi:hypothetical protein
LAEDKVRRSQGCRDRRLKSKADCQEKDAGEDDLGSQSAQKKNRQLADPRCQLANSRKFTTMEALQNGPKVNN